MQIIKNCLFFVSDAACYLLRLNLPFSKISSSFHQRFAKQISWAVVTSDWFWFWYPGLRSKYHSIHGSSSGNQGDHHRGHTRSIPARALKTLHIKWLSRREIPGEVFMFTINELVVLAWLLFHLISFDLQLGTALTASSAFKRKSVALGDREGKVVVCIEWPSKKDVPYQIQWHIPEVWWHVDAA